jgi:hypothetical protein
MPDKQFINRFFLLLALQLLQMLLVFGQDNKIEIPAFNDKYSKYVEQLERGELNIDYSDFRNSFLDSKQYEKREPTMTVCKNKFIKKLKIKIIRV